MGVARLDSLVDKVLTRVKEFASAGARGSRSAAITIGVEHEFFLCNLRGELARIEDSQRFLKELSVIATWKIQASQKIDGDELMTRVSKEHDNGTYSCVKYEYLPHLLEVAVGYRESVHGLKATVLPIWAELAEAASRAEVKIHSVPMVESEEVQHLVKEAHRLMPSLVGLSKSRQAWASEQKRELTLGEVEFTAATAATQVHIGGVEWWLKPEIVHEIYLIEPTLQPVAYGLLGQPGKANKVLVNRWARYGRVFDGLQLFGFPSLSRWDHKSWGKALIHSPLVTDLGGSEALTLEKLSKDESPDLDMWLPRVRDLQIVKPKMFGTLEFRADPALPGPEEILALACLRLGQCLAAKKRSERNRSRPDLTKAHQEWWAVAKGDKKIDWKRARKGVEEICAELEARNNHEHELLSGVYGEHERKAG